MDRNKVLIRQWVDDIVDWFRTSLPDLSYSAQDN